jgi:hypothetical protein
VRNEGVSITATWEGNALALVLSQTKGWERYLDALEPTVRPPSASLGHRKVQAPDGRQGTQHAKRTLPVGAASGPTHLPSLCFLPGDKMQKCG